MTRLYLRLWASAVVVFVGTLLAYDTLVWTVTTEAEETYYADLAGMFEALTPRTVEGLDALSNDLGYPVALVDIPSIDAQLDGHTRVVYGIADGGDLAFVRRADGAVVRFGPMAPFPNSYDWRHLLVLIGVVTVLAIVVRLGLAPLDRSQRAIEATAKRMAAGDLDARIEADGSGVVSAANQLADTLAHRVEAQRALLHAVSHELRTPIARLRLAVGLAQRVEDADSRARHLASLDDDLQSIDDLIEELLDFARLDVHPMGGDAWSVVDSLVSVSGDATLEAPSTLPRPPVSAALFERAVGNLVRNAQRYAVDAVVVRAEARAGRLWVCVDDDGPGIPEAERQRVREPFVRLGDRAGHGLGLAIVERIARRTGGCLNLAESPAGGLRASLDWSPGTPASG